MPENTRKVGVSVVANAVEANKTFQQTKEEIRSIGDEGVKAGRAATAAMNGLSTAARGQAAALGSTKTAVVSNADALRNYEREILEARAGLANLSQQIAVAAKEFGGNSKQAKDLRAEYRLQGAATRGLVADKAL